MNLDFPTTAGALGKSLGASVVGDGMAPVRVLAPLKDLSVGALSFCAGRSQGEILNSLSGGVLFASPDVARDGLKVTFLVVDNPRAAFARVAHLFSTAPTFTGISKLAEIDATAVLGEDANVGAYAVIGAGAKIGNRTFIYPHAYVGAGVEIGDDCLIYPRVTLLDRCTVGNRVKIFPGTVIGADGFGLMDQPGDRLVEMPQIGIVQIEDDVTIGANCTIDRATLGSTKIGRGTKLDNLVHVGHNSVIGENCILCGQAGLAGSVTLGDRVVLGGQAGVRDHVSLGSGARLGGQAGASSDLEGGKDYFLSPAISLGQSLKVLRELHRLPKLAQRIRVLEKIMGQSKSKG